MVGLLISHVVQLFRLSVFVFAASIQSAANPPPINSQFVLGNKRTEVTVASGTRASEVRAQDLNGTGSVCRIDS